MNAFYRHHKDSISFHYRCFDGMLFDNLLVAVGLKAA